MDDQEILAAIGQIVVNASVLESEVAVLAALTEGSSGEAAHNRAREIAGKTGQAVSLLRSRAESDHRLGPLLRDVKGALGERGILAHSVAYLVSRQADEDFVFLPGGEGAPFYDDDELLVIWHPRTDRRTFVTLHQLRLQAQGLRIAVDRVRQAVAERTAAPLL